MDKRTYYLDPVSLEVDDEVVCVCQGERFVHAPMMIDENHVRACFFMKLSMYTLMRIIMSQLDPEKEPAPKIIIEGEEGTILVGEHILSFRIPDVMNMPFKKDSALHSELAKAFIELRSTCPGCDINFI